MKYLVQIFFCLLFCTQVKGQNLISNPSFEDIDSCYGQPAGIGFDVFQWSGCDGWSCPTTGSSDLWCQNPIIGNQIPPTIPGAGYQLPHSGENMSGLLVYVQHVEYREYIQNELVQELIPNVYYDFKLFVNNSAYESEYNVATSCIEAYFSQNPPVLSDSYLPFQVTPQIRNLSENIIFDTLNWITINGTYKAIGGEKFITIGCFQNDLEIILTREVSDSIGGNIYFFIDDVELIESSSQAVIPNVFSPNDDGVNEYYFPTVINIPDWEMIILNRWGNVMSILNEKKPFWDGKIDEKYAEDGIYYYSFTSSNKIYNEQGYFHLVK